MHSTFCRVYVAALIRPYVPVVFLGALILGTGGGGKDYCAILLLSCCLTSVSLPKCVSLHLVCPFELNCLPLHFQQTVGWKSL